MLETLLSLPGFLYQAGGKHYYLGKWICKECTDQDASDCLVMYHMCRDAGEKKETALYFQKLRAYSDFALDIPYDPAKIRSNLAALLDALDEGEKKRLAEQAAMVSEDQKHFA